MISGRAIGRRARAATTRLRAIGRRAAMPLLAVWVLSAQPAPAAQTATPSVETIVEIRVQGNFTVPAETIVAASGLAVGDPVPADLTERVRRRLEQTGRFESVDVRKRYRSLTSTTDVAVILVVRERPGAAASGPVRRWLIGLASRTMVLPILRHDEGYGVTFGARTSLVDLIGAEGRLSVPGTWGGHRRIAVEADTSLPDWIGGRAEAGIARRRQRHPTFDLDDDRTVVWLGASRRLVAGLRLMGEVVREDVRFGGGADRLTRYSVDLAYGAAGSSMFPRDQVMLSGGVEWLHVSGRAGASVRPRIDARAFTSLVGQAVLMLRGRVVGASGPLPAYERPLIGGGGSVRGWPVGADVGDRLAIATVELRLPMSSPLSAGTAGVRLFYDTGAAYDVGQSIRRQVFRQGAGGGVFLQVPLLRLSVDAAHNLRGAARVHVGAAVSF